MRYLLALDQGTSSSRSIVFDLHGRQVAQAQRELPQIYPQPGWVEHDPMQIWDTQLQTARDALRTAGIQAHQIAGVGLTNQRETTIVWDRATGRPIHNAIVWQDRRSEPACAALREAGREAWIHSKTGLRVDAYFSATKLQWLLDHVPQARQRAIKGELAFGTVDSWLLWRLTGGQVHATDISNASRTMLFNIHSQQWDDELTEHLNIPRQLLPRVHPSAYAFGTTEAQWFGEALPIAGIAGDQQSALFGQACLDAGMAKNTYGTGCFMLMHTGTQAQSSSNGLITTCAAQTSETRQYAIEGSVFVGGAVVQWLRDGLHAISGSDQVQSLAESVPDSGGVVVVPAFTGLGAPYWKPHARGTITGLTRGTTIGHIARAALESIAFQSAALLQAMSRDAVSNGGRAVTELRVDGGASVNNLLMQFQADLLGIPVVRPAVTETTALGAALLAGLSTEALEGLDEVRSLWRAERRFLPTMNPSRAAELMAEWEHAVAQSALPR
jgi:glycerol kinase